MDDRLFAELQKEICWFTLPLFEELPEIVPGTRLEENEIWDDDVCLMRHLFAMIFGGYGYPVMLTRAKSICTLKLLRLGTTEPPQDLNDPNFTSWLNRFAQYNVLYATALAYQGNYVRAAQFFMNALKTAAIDLFMPYCDFIRNVLSKLEHMPCELAQYEGRGFSADDPMGAVPSKDGRLIASMARMVIPALEGDNGEIVLFYEGMSSYGNMKRLGSVLGSNSDNCIDVYEVLMVDGDGKLKKLRLYFDGYFSFENRNNIRLPKGFHLEIASRAAKMFKVVD